MEEAGLLQSKELYQYLLKTSVYPTEQEFVKELREATAKHPEACMGTGPDAGQLMTLLLKLINAKKTIEIGVFTGYSLLLTALSLPKDGKITAIDINGEAYETVGEPIVRKAGVEHKIDFIVSPAHPVLDKLLENTENEGSFDFAYVDADKDNYINYHEKLLKLVRVGGVILYDNTLCGGTVAIEDKSTITEPYYIYNTPFAIELNKFLATDTRIQIAHIPVSDGSTICIRLH